MATMSISFLLDVPVTKIKTGRLIKLFLDSILFQNDKGCNVSPPLVCIRFDDGFVAIQIDIPDPKLVTIKCGLKLHNLDTV